MPSITATYTSPTNTPSPHPLSASLPAISPDPSTKNRVAYLVAMQSAVRTLQSEVNAFLTQRMDDDKAQGGAGAKADDVKEEETYGEEIDGLAHNGPVWLACLAAQTWVGNGSASKNAEHSRTL
ncbi:hypothetical protein CC78DRAFT_581718 [Lojkania enalia]|uniref:EKC/KEOPS complex subunit GON7 n=1 Tax=Lojkania enalia TaxID=147567 RepID=A0A9P4N7X0_9PLEO|nr:hypothetical protein CC78DRAFT_581718 [Didymosphaeria enalia]